jgi:PAS domain S-box-containing protein
MATELEAPQNYRSLARRSLSLSRLLAILSALFPLMSITGWILEIPFLKQGHPALPAMMPNTAIGLLLSALCVLLIQRDTSHSRPKIIPALIAAVISLLGILTLGEYALGWNLGIDQIFVPGATISQQPFPGRPSPQTSLNFALLGIAFFSLNSLFPSVYGGQVLTILLAANAIIAATGYIFNTSHFYGFPVYGASVGMAIHTSAAFIILAGALLLSRPGEGLMALATSDTRSGLMARKIMLSALLAPPVVGVLTRIGVIAGWYEVDTQISLFSVVIMGLIIRATWRAARYAEAEEHRAVAALKEISLTSERLRRLAEEKQLFYALVENSLDFIGIADPTGKPIYVNRAGRRIVGLPDDFPIENTQIAEYYSPEQRSFAENVIVKAMMEKGHWRGETSFRNWKTGETIPVSDEHFMIRDLDTNKILGMGTVTRDISDIKEAQEKIREAQERFELALRGADLATWDWNIKTGEVKFNSRWAGMRGYRLDEIKPNVDTWTSGIHPEDLPLVQKALRDYFAGTAHEYSIEFRVATKSGEWIWILDRGSIFARDENGNPARMVGTELEITLRKQLDEELRISEAKFSGIVSVSADSIISIDEDQRIVLFNEGSKKMFGYSKEEILGKPIDILIPEKFRAIHRQQVRNFSEGAQVARKMGERSTQISGLRKNGEEFPADAAISKIAVGGRRILTVALRDVTEQKKVETDLQLYAEIARAAAKAREHVLAVVSHDLKNPLASIGIVAQLLQKLKQLEKSKVDEYAERIHRSVENMQTLIGDLLDFGKIQAGTFAVEMSRENITDIIQWAFDSIKPLAETKKIGLEIRIEPELPFVACDAARIKQVLSNLLGNAIKFTPEGGRVCLTAAGQEKDILVSVSDTGPGIPAEQLPKVFDRFWQAQETRQLGSGLGLSIAKGIINAHGTKIWAESKVGSGATFFFTVPKETPDSVKNEASSESRKDSSSFYGKKVV